METDKQPLPSRSSFTLSLKAIMFPFHAKRLYTIKLFMWSKTMRHISIKLSCRLFSSFVLWFIFQMRYTKYCKDLLSNSAVEQVLIIPNSKINITTVVMLILLKWETVKI